MGDSESRMPNAVGPMWLRETVRLTQHRKSSTYDVSTHSASHSGSACYCAPMRVRLAVSVTLAVCVNDGVTGSVCVTDAVTLGIWLCDCV